MSGLSLFGLIAMSAMVISYALEKRGPGYILAFALSCALAAIYGFLQGAWPFGIAELVWSAIAVRRWVAVKAAMPSGESR